MQFMSVEHKEWKKAELFHGSMQSILLAFVINKGGA